MLASDVTNADSLINVIPRIYLQVGIPFLVVSCAAVAAGFLGGFFKSPRGTTTAAFVI